MQDTGPLWSRDFEWSPVASGLLRQVGSTGGVVNTFLWTTAEPIYRAGTSHDHGVRPALLIAAGGRQTPAIAGPGTAAAWPAGPGLAGAAIGG